MGDFHLMLQMGVTPYISGLKKNLVILFRAFNFLFKTTKLAKKSFLFIYVFPQVLLIKLWECNVPWL